MTLVVARIAGDRVAVAADTMITAGDVKLPMHQWVMKSICLPGGICVSYCNSPDLAFRALRAFRTEYPAGAGFSDVIAFFERWSSRTNNDFLIAFPHPARLVTVRDGKRTTGLSRTHWIGDRAAYARFRHVERGAKRHDMGRAINAVVFADEMSGSPASDLYSAMRDVVRDNTLNSVGGLVTVLSNRGRQFRYSVYSDALFDWPAGRPADIPFVSKEQIDLAASGENDGFSVSQISPGCYGPNAVAFYYLKGRLLITLSETEEGWRCTPVQSVEPSQIAQTLDRKFGFPFRALCLVISARKEYSMPADWRSTVSANGVGFSLFCELNTFASLSGPRDVDVGGDSVAEL